MLGFFCRSFESEARFFRRGFLFFIVLRSLLEFIIAIDHNALTSALDGNKANKTYQSRLTRLVNRLLPYQFEIGYIPRKDMLTGTK